MEEMEAAAAAAGMTLEEYLKPPEKRAEAADDSDGAQVSKPSTQPTVPDWERAAEPDPNNEDDWGDNIL